MQFEWYADKNRSKLKKHSVWFEEAQTIWVDPSALEFYDPDHSQDEDRFLRIGFSSIGRLLLVVYCERAGGGVLRIIGARQATPKERKQYAERI